MRRVEELLREQLLELGVNPEELPAHEIARGMHCGVRADGALSYSWKGTPILDVLPEPQDDGRTQWRLFTRETPLQ